MGQHDQQEMGLVLQAAIEHNTKGGEVDFAQALQIRQQHIRFD
jgi:hypothetical protein